jgi:hypothetical protein
MKIKALVISLALFVPSIASADYHCDGAVKYLTLSPEDGTVTVSIGTLDSVYLCRIGSTFNGVTAEICKAVHAQLLAATIAGRDVRINRRDSGSCTAATPCCTTSWGILTNWYGGPLIL